MEKVYVICGDSIRLINEKINEIVNTDNVINFNYNDINMSSLINEASYVSLDSTYKFIIVKNCDIFKNKDKDEELLVDYINNAKNDCSIIFIVDSIDARKKIVKTIKENNGLIQIPKIDYKNVYEYINKYVLANGYKIDYTVSRYLVNNVGLNIDLIYNELDKIFLYYNKKCSIKLEDVEGIVVKPIDNNMYHFIDACITKNYNNALRIYHDLKLYKIEDVVLVIMLAYEYKKMFVLKKSLQNHESRNSILKKMGLQDWQFDKIYNNSLNYSDRELLDIIKYLAILDEKIKMGNINKDIVINNFLIYIMK